MAPEEQAEWKLELEREFDREFEPLERRMVWDLLIELEDRLQRLPSEVRDRLPSVTREARRHLRRGGRTNVRAAEALLQNLWRQLGIETLAREAAIGVRQLDGARRGGLARSTTSDKARERRERNEQWRRQAIALWTRHPAWSVSDVARGIDRNRVRSVRRAIGDLKPSSN